MVNFRIIENYSHEHKFNDFSRDYRKGLTKKELLKKYDISPTVWHEWKERLPIRPNYTKRRPKAPRRLRPIEDWKLARTYVGNVTLYRRWKGQYYSYGTYPNEKIAIMVQELLKDSKWDTDLAVDLIKKYAVRISKNCLLSHIYERDEKMMWND